MRWNSKINMKEKQVKGPSAIATEQCCAKSKTFGTEAPTTWQVAADKAKKAEACGSSWYTSQNSYSFFFKTKVRVLSLKNLQLDTFLWQKKTRKKIKQKQKQSKETEKN